MFSYFSHYWQTLALLHVFHFIVAEGTKLFKRRKFFVWFGSVFVIALNAKAVIVSLCCEITCKVLSGTLRLYSLTPLLRCYLSTRWCCMVCVCGMAACVSSVSPSCTSYSIPLHQQLSEELHSTVAWSKPVLTCDIVDREKCPLLRNADHSPSMVNGTAATRRAQKCNSEPSEGPFASPQLYVRVLTYLYCLGLGL